MVTKKDYSTDDVLILLMELTLGQQNYIGTTATGGDGTYTIILWSDSLTTNTGLYSIHCL